MDKYIAICTWVENDEKQWDAVTDLTSKDEAQIAVDNVSWDGPNMNQKFSVINENTYLELLKLEQDV